MHKHWKDEASFGDLIISHLLSCSSIKIQRKILYGLVQKRRALDKKVFSKNLSRLKNKEIVSFGSGEDIIINKRVLKLHTLFRNIETKPIGNMKVMVLFDIPEKKRKVRNWLRLQLKLWNFEMVQQSAWMGKGPLPKEFIERLRSLGINKGVKILKFKA